MSILFVLASCVFLILLWEKQPISWAALSGLVIFAAIFASLLIVQLILDNNRYRVAVALNQTSIGTLGWLWFFTFNWSEIKKITVSSAKGISLPPAEFNLWISRKSRKIPIFTRIPKLVTTKREAFLAVLEMHTKANGIELIFNNLALVNQERPSR